jgi:hypothetical protein
LPRSLPPSLRFCATRRLGKPAHKLQIPLQTAFMKYVYILECTADSDRHHTGVTDNLKARFRTIEELGENDVDNVIFTKEK